MCVCVCVQTFFNDYILCLFLSQGAMPTFAVPAINCPWQTNGKTCKNDYKRSSNGCSSFAAWTAHQAPRNPVSWSAQQWIDGIVQHKCITQGKEVNWNFWQYFKQNIKYKMNRTVFFLFLKHWFLTNIFWFTVFLLLKRKKITILMLSLKSLKNFILKTFCKKTSFLSLISNWLSRININFFNIFNAKEYYFMFFIFKHHASLITLHSHFEIYTL